MSLIGRSVAFAAATLLIVAATGVAGTNHREHAVQRLKQSLAGLPLRAPTHAPLDPARAWS